MFTGMIEELGRVRELSKIGSIYKLAIESSAVFKDANIGDSVSINGVCLTVTKKRNDILYFDAVEETAQRTNLMGLRESDMVNLESAVKAGQGLGGHFVLGHIDCKGVIKKFQRESGNVSMEIGIPNGFRRLIVERGSVAIEGVSLTVGDISDCNFKVHLIPHTLKATNLGTKRTGDRVNIEFDIIGKHILRFSELERGKITESFLKNNGFCDIV